MTNASMVHSRTPPELRPSKLWPEPSDSRRPWSAYETRDTISPLYTESRWPELPTFVSIPSPRTSSIA